MLSVFCIILFLYLVARHAHKKEESLFCPVCKVGDLKGKERLKIHLFKDHGIGEMFRCEECRHFESPVKGAYLRHLARHHQPAPALACEFCGKPFRSRAGLKLHVRQHRQDRLWRCSECPFSTPQRSNLVRHLAARHRKGVDGADLKADFKCTEGGCDFSCVSEHQLKSHRLRRHTARENMRFRCSECDYASVEKASLEKHVRFRHTKERPYMCNVCGFRYCLRGVERKRIFLSFVGSCKVFPQKIVV